jgi:hypothetical protein
MRSAKMKVMQKMCHQQDQALGQYAREGDDL